MLSSIHPFGERSRNNSFRLTAAAHVIGSMLGGAMLGVGAGAIGLAPTALGPSTGARNPLLLCVVVVGLVLEATGRERLLPTRTRQVNENWIQSYRGWVYGGGFGAELGFGVSTIITTTLVHVLVASLILLGSWTGAIALGTLFGAVRGATVLAAHGVDSPESLRQFHRTLDRLRSASRSGAVVSLLAATAIGVGALIS